MSKSLGNIVDPWIMMDKYGVDTLRLWMYSVNQPRVKTSMRKSGAFAPASFRFVV